MKCPYCLSEIDQEAVVCKVCTRDVYLFKVMMAKVDDLESRLAAVPSQPVYEQRIRDLESELAERINQPKQEKSIFKVLFEILAYIGVPLILLLLSHLLITIVYDTKMLYLRLISMILPLPFGYFLFQKESRALFPWFLGVIFLALLSVIGMSWITSLVDGTPIWPQNLFEWKEVLEYSASIAFSFLTGMLIGGVVYLGRIRRRNDVLLNSVSKSIMHGLASEKLSVKNLGTLAKKLEEYGGMVVAIGTTAVSIYTGLKGIIG